MGMLVRDGGSGRQALTAGILAYAWWGLVPLYWKLLDAPHDLEVLAHRVLWSAVIMLPVMRRSGAALWREHGRRRPVVIALLSSSSICLAINWGLFVWAVGDGRVVEVAFGYFVTPLATVLLGRLVLRELLTWRHRIGIAGAVGALLVLAAGEPSPPWVALGLAGSFAAYGVIRKAAGVSAVPGFAVEIGALAVPASAYLAYLMLTASPSAGGHGASVGLLAGLGLVSTVPMLLFGSALRGIELSSLALLQYLAPSVQFLLGVTVFEQEVAPSKFIAFGLLWATLAASGTRPILRSVASVRSWGARWS